MSDSIALIPAHEIKPAPMEAEVHPPTIDISVTGTSRETIALGHQQLIGWCEAKIAAEQRDFDELQTAYRLAKKKKWKHTTLQAHANKAHHRVLYYQKMLAAFQAGFVLIPRFQMSVFAIRTDRKWPKKITSFNKRYAEQDRQPDKLPVGEGNYVNPSPTTSSYHVRDTDDGGKIKTQWASQDWDGIDFPMEMAKPEIMEAVDHAMALKIFDEVGILPFRRTKGDPIIGGIIRMGGVSKWSAKECHFILAWHVDTRTL